METQTIIDALVPDNWDEVTISQYQEIANLDKQDSDTLKFINILAILLDKDPDEISRINMHSFKKLIELTEWTRKMPLDANFKPIVKIDGKEYGFINRLTDLTLENWIDLEEYMVDKVNNFHLILAILYRPLVVALSDSHRILEPCNRDSFYACAEIFRTKGKIGEMYGVSVFFSHIVKESTITIKEYLVRELITMNYSPTNHLRNESSDTNKKSWMKSRLRSGCGFVMRMFWPKEISQKWIAYLHKTLSLPSTSKPLN